MQKILLATVVSLGLLFGCAAPLRPKYLELELSFVPENSVAVKMGATKVVGQGGLRGDNQFEFELGREKFTANSQTIDNSVTTTARGASNTRAAAIAANNSGSVGVAQSRAQTRSASTETTAQGASNSVIRGVSNRGTTLSCDVMVNNKSYTSTGSCVLSNGAKYQIFGKPLAWIMTDGSRRPM